MKYADAIIVLTKAAQNYFKETYGRKTVLIPNGVNNQSSNIGDDITSVCSRRQAPSKSIFQRIHSIASLIHQRPTG